MLVLLISFSYRFMFICECLVKIVKCGMGFGGWGLFRSVWNSSWGLRAKVGRLKAKVRRLKAKVGRLKAKVHRVPWVKVMSYLSKPLITCDQWYQITIIQKSNSKIRIMTIGSSMIEFCLIFEYWSLRFIWNLKLKHWNLKK